MPIYEYECRSCGHRLEVIQKMNDPLLKDCPACGQATLKKLMSAAGFHLKGTGWYATDFKGGGSKPENKTETTKPEPDTTSPKKKAGGCGGGTCGCAH
ncbi:MAG: FmdB family zinc ribbon protein [Sulfuricaulis sp.]